jgi:hypothetical protein
MLQRFVIFARMKKPLLSLVVLLLGALPALAQTSPNELGILFGGSKRIASRADLPAGTTVEDENFDLDNSVMEVYYGLEMEPGTMLKFKVGRIQTPISVREPLGGGAFEQVIYDDGEVDHIDALIEYRFSEAFGSTALFAGAGYYRASADGAESASDYGLSAGVNGDFPLTRAFGVKLEGAYHWTNLPYRPRYVTVTAGLRVAF